MTLTDGLLDAHFPLPLDRPFTTEQARRVGLSANRLTRLVSDGLLRRLLKNVYVTAQVEDSLRLRIAALALVVPADSVVTDRTAGWVHGGNVLAPNDHLRVPPVQIFRHAGHTRLRNGLCLSGQRTFLPEDLMEIDGVTVTTSLRTALDLGRLLHRDHAIGALDSMLRVGGFTLEELLAQVERFKGQRGVVQLRELAPLADARSQSPGESTLRLRWLDCGDLPRPEPQTPVRDRFGRTVYWLDLGVEALRFGAEYDGKEFHSSPEDREHDRQRRKWMRDERGWLVRVFERDDVYGPLEDAGLVLRQGIHEARRRLGEFRP
ncbi:MAG: type IV toxin-antitoxin system AbiEi family antitoxin domain-containing protein [Nocardioidaceae bacterium]